MKKLTVLIAIFLLLAALPALVQAAEDSPPAPTAPPGELQVFDARLWPPKADWPGQKVSFVPAKLYASASYLLVFNQPGQEITGADQLFFTRKLVGKTYTIQGLYELTKKGAAPEYYWRLDGPNGQAAAWVKDTRGGLLANMPFVLGREIAEENKLRAELEALSDKKVWIDRNRVAKSELSADVDHLVPLTITGFKSAGPFSELYVMTFEQANGEPLVWQLSATGNRAAYSHSQYLQLFQRDFYGQDPVSLHPEWPAAVWGLIKAREIRVGWTKEMVAMSWGEADKHEIIELGPNKGLTQWRYPEGYRLYFKEKTLVKIRIPKPADKNKNQAITPSGKDTMHNKDGKEPKDDGLIDVPGAAKVQKVDKPQEVDNTKEAV